MTRTNGLKVFFVAALGALAMLALPAVAGAKDRNHDRIPDRWEKRHHLSLHRSQAGRDQDRDHLRNRAEFMAGDNPRDADTDNDGVEDGDENAGTIQSFDQETGKLTIALFGGDTISGVVNEGTAIECDDHVDATTSNEGDGTSSGHDEQSGDDEGEHSGENEGDDSGEHHGEEPGDDNGGEAGDDDQGEDHDGEPGEDHDGEPGDDNQGEDHGNCTTADLTEGAVVKEAELHLSNGQAVFEKVELTG